MPAWTDPAQSDKHPRLAAGSSRLFATSSTVPRIVFSAGFIRCSAYGLPVVQGKSNSMAVLQQSCGRQSLRVCQPGSITRIRRHDDYDLVLRKRAVSGHHAKIIQSEQPLCLEDLQTCNGNQVNGRTITEPVLLVCSDGISILESCGAEPISAEGISALFGAADSSPRSNLIDRIASQTHVFGGSAVLQHDIAMLALHRLPADRLGTNRDSNSSERELQVPE